MNLVFELYIEGHTIDAIAEELMVTSDDVIEILRSYKKKGYNGKDYTDNFKEMVVERIISGSNKVGVTRELGVAYKTINKYLEEFNVDVPKSKKDQEEYMFEEIEWESFTQCPTCGNNRVNDLNIYKDEGLDLKNSYCMECGTEWLQKDGKTLRVVWQFVE